MAIEDGNQGVPNADILVSREGQYQTPISYRVEELGRLWEIVSQGTNKYNGEYEGFIKCGSLVGNLGEEPKIRLIKDRFALELGIGDTYSYKVAIDPTMIEEALGKILEAEIKFKGKAIYRDGERIATLANRCFRYEPTGPGGVIRDEAHFARALREGLEVYRVLATELLRANDLSPDGNEVMIWPGEYELKNPSRNQEAKSDEGEITIGVLVTPEKIDVSFSDIGGQRKAVEICQSFADMLRFPAAYEMWGSKPPRGILMAGPPGNGKTLMAKAMAGKADALFLCVKSSDIVGVGLYGSSEKATALMFEQAREAAAEAGKHCIIYLDEIDLVLPSNKMVMGRHEATGRTIEIFSQYMDGLVENPWLTVMASTNDPEDIDPRILSRMEIQVEVPRLDRAGLQQVLEIQGQKRAQIAGRQLFSEDIDLRVVAEEAYRLEVSGRDAADAVNTLLLKRGQQQLAVIIKKVSEGKTGSELKESVSKAIELVRKGEMPELTLPPIGTNELLVAIKESKARPEEKSKDFSLIPQKKEG